LQHFLDPAIEPLHHAVGLGGLRRGQAVFDFQGGAERVEFVLARCGPFAQTKKSVGELLAIVREDGADTQRTSAFQIPQEAARIGRCLCREDADEHPPRRPVDCHKEVSAAVFISHLRQIFYVDVDVSGLVGLEGAVFWPGSLGLQVAQVSNAMAPQTPIKP